MLDNAAKPILSVQNLYKRFESSKSFLWQNVSFDLKTGESLSIRGESGSGKSTLLFAIGGMETVQNGTVLFEGKTLIHSQHTWVPAISYIFQHYHLIEELTVSENITLPARMHPNHNHRSVQMLAEALNLQPLLSRLPTHLSGGERQRVAIARALITQPTLLLADEPTGSLDEATGTRVMDLLLQTCKTFHAACILVTHNNAFAARTQRHFVLHNQQLNEVP